MQPLRSRRWTIALGVCMIVLLVAITVAWVLLTVTEALAKNQMAGLYWGLLSIGTVFLVLVIVGTALYLTLSIKAINLNQRQSNFIDSVTHELKSPIASLKLYLQTLNRRSVSEEQAGDFYRFMLDDVERLDHLINHLLDAARADQAPVREQVVDVDLSETLRSCVQAVTARYRVPAETISVSLQPALVRARPVDAELVFRNLIDNAVKYAGSPPEVTVECVNEPAGKIRVRISDNGRGIPFKFRHKLFHRFARLGSELEREKPGTGLGLYIARTLVQRMRGKIVVRDQPEHNGTVFEVQLPACPPASTLPDIERATSEAIP